MVPRGLHPPPGIGGPLAAARPGLEVLRLGQFGVRDPQGTGTGVGGQPWAPGVGQGVGHEAPLGLPIVGTHSPGRALGALGSGAVRWGSWGPQGPWEAIFIPRLQGRGSPMVVLGGEKRQVTSEGTHLCGLPAGFLTWYLSAQVSGGNDRLCGCDPPSAAPRCPCPASAPPAGGPVRRGSPGSLPPVLSEVTAPGDLTASAPLGGRPWTAAAVAAALAPAGKSWRGSSALAGTDPGPCPCTEPRPRPGSEAPTPGPAQHLCGPVGTPPLAGGSVSPIPRLDH